MTARLLKGAFIGLLAAFGAWGLGADSITMLLLLSVALVIAITDVLVAEVFALLMVFAIDSLIWSYTPVGNYIGHKLMTMQKRSAN
jgi:hypothetical protein